jgi:hypothetical protein
VTFGGRFKASTSLTVRMALLAWTGTEDSVTSDVVNDWTSSSYTAGGFFNSTTLAVVAVSSAAISTTASDVFVTGTVPTGTKNLIVVYWTESTAAQNVTVDAWGQRVVLGVALADHVRRSYADELALCQRRCEKLAYTWVADGRVGGADYSMVLSFKVEKAGTPTITTTAGALTNATLVATNPTVTTVEQRFRAGGTGTMSVLSESLLAVIEL